MGCNGSKSTNTANQGKQDGDIWVTVDEAVKHVVNELGVSEERARKMVESVNHDNDGKVSNKELLDLWKRIKETRDALRPRFVQYDKDESGWLSIDEALPILRALFKDVSDDNLRKMAKRYDDDNNDKMNYSEFVYFYCNVVAKQEQVRQKFSELDKDNSGDLSYEELKQLLMKECALEEKMALCIVDDCDVNKDGKVNRAEFENLCIKLFTGDVGQDSSGTTTNGQTEEQKTQV